MTPAPVRTKIYTDDTYTYVCEAAVGTPLAEASWSIFRYDSDGSTAFPVVDGAIVTDRRLVAANYASYTYTSIDE